MHASLYTAHHHHRQSATTLPLLAADPSSFLPPLLVSIPPHEQGGKNGYAPPRPGPQPAGVAVGDGHVHQPALPPPAPVREGAPVREAAHAQRRGEAEPPGDPQAARGEVLPPRRQRRCRRRRRQREGPAAGLGGRGRQAVAVPVLVLGQQPELRAHQGLEPLRQGEAPRRRRRRALRPRARPRPRRRRPPLHLLQAPRRERRGGDAAAARGARAQRRRAAAAVEPHHVLQHVGGVVVPGQPRQPLRLPQRYATRRRGRRQGQRHAYSAVEEAPAVRRQPRLRPGAGDADGGGNVRLRAPESLRSSACSSQLLERFIRHRGRKEIWSHALQKPEAKKLATSTTVLYSSVCTERQVC